SLRDRTRRGVLRGAMKSMGKSYVEFPVLTTAALPVPFRFSHDLLTPLRYSLRQEPRSSPGRPDVGEIAMSEHGSAGNVPTRRDFLHQAAGAVAAATAAAAPGADTPAVALLPTVKLGTHHVTRLILGGNPIYGYSHFNKLFSQHLIDWHTPQRVVELVERCVKAGINTWQNSYAERTLQDVDRVRHAGVKFHWLCLGKPDWDRHPERIAEAAKRKPIGIAPHGALAERLHRQNKLTELADLLKRIRDGGVGVVLWDHTPAVIELAEEKGWDIDYYMCCLYYLTRPREEIRKVLGDAVPLGEIYLPSDPPRMFRVIRA